MEGKESQNDSGNATRKLLPRSMVLLLSIVFLWGGAFFAAGVTPIFF